MSIKCCHPCTPATGRYPGCHDTCTRYASEKAQIAHVQAERTKYWQVESGCREVKDRAFRYIKKDKAVKRSL